MNHLKIFVIILIIGLLSVIFILSIFLIKNKNKCVNSSNLPSCPKLPSCPNIDPPVSLICPPSGLKNIQEINDPEIKKFKK